MTSKEYLSQIRNKQAVIDIKLRELEYWRQLSTRVTAVKCDGMPHNPNRPTEAPFVACIAKIDELERDVSAKIVELSNLWTEVTTAIDALKNEKERLLLRYRYLDGSSWNKIEQSLNVSERTAFRIHETALQNFNVPK